MHAQRFDPDKSVLLAWVKATTFGWWLGFAIIIVLVLAVDVILPGAGGSQFMVGVGMGAGVGIMQMPRISQWFGTPYSWFLASTIGMGAPFVAGDLARVLELGIPYSLVGYVAIGSLLVALLQWQLLQAVSHRAAWWVPAAVIGWMLPVALIALNDVGVAPGLAGQIIALFGMFFGGAVLGGVTGAVLDRYVWRSRF